MKNIFLILFSAVVLAGCGTKERAELKLQVDSLKMVIIENTEAEATLDEVAILLDSIDASRNELRLRIVDGITYADYIERLKQINTHIKDSQTRIVSLETSLKRSKHISASTIKRLRTDLDVKSSELVELQ